MEPLLRILVVALSRVRHNTPIAAYFQWSPDRLNVRLEGSLSMPMRALWSLAGVVAVCGCASPAAPRADASTQADVGKVGDAAAVGADIADAETATDAPGTVDSGGETAVAVLKPCLSASQCPPLNTVCRYPVCTDGVCGAAPAPDASPCGSVACGSASCQAGQCMTKLAYTDHAFNDIAVNQVNSGCVYGGETLLVGWAKIGGQAGKAAWLGRVGAKAPLPTQPPASTLWQGGFAAELNACYGYYGPPWAVGWQQTGDGAERDSVWLQLSEGVVISALSLPVGGDDELRAVDRCYGCNHEWAAAGEVTQPETGLDARLVVRSSLVAATQSLVFATAGDQYVRGLAGSGYEGPAGWILCGYQSIDGGAADAWILATGPGGAHKWTTVVGDAHVQRLHACAISGDKVLAVGVTFTPHGNKEALGRPWLVQLDRSDGKVLWQRTQSLQWANGGELLALAHTSTGQWWTAGFLRAAGVEFPAWQRFDSNGWLQAAGEGQTAGSALFIHQHFAYLQDDWLAIGVRPAATLRSVLAVRDGSGGTHCGCKAESQCPGDDACQLAQCGGPCGKVWQGNPCPLADGVTGTCSSDGSCVAP